MAATKKEEVVHPFLWEVGAVDILRDAAKMGAHEYDDGLAAFLKNGEYHLLPGGVPPLEVWESASIGDRFAVVGRYPSVTIVVRIADARGLQSFMNKYIPAVTILPEIMIPQPVEPQNNHQTYHVPRMR